MNKILVFSLIFMLLISCFASLSYASNITDDSLYSGSTEDLTYTPVSVGSTGALSSTSLTFANILNIILIVIGILLVLFAIAILIRVR